MENQEDNEDVIEIKNKEQLLNIFGAPVRRDPYGFLRGKDILTKDEASRDEEI